MINSEISVQGCEDDDENYDLSFGSVWSLAKDVERMLIQNVDIHWQVYTEPDPRRTASYDEIINVRGKE